MRMRKLLLTIIICFAAILPSKAVFNEKDLAMTLRVLRYELARTYAENRASQDKYASRDDRQHEELVKLIKSCNELSLMLYSQKQNFTFDLTYALHQVTKQYRDFNESRLPYDQIVSFIDIEIERYDKLANTLAFLPPALVEIPDSLGPRLLDSLAATLQGRLIDDEPFAERRSGMESRLSRVWTRQDEGVTSGDFALSEESQADRDSCLYYARALFDLFTGMKDDMEEDNKYFEATSKRLKDSYEYAQERYKVVQKRIFVEGQDDYWKVLTDFVPYTRKAFAEARDKYGRGDGAGVKSEWRGPIVIGFSFTILFYLVIAAILSNLIVKILQKRVAYFKTEDFSKKRLSWLLLASALLFVIVIGGVRVFLRVSNFFVMASGLISEFALLLIAVLASIIVRYESDKANSGLWLYMPVMLLGLLVIAFRIMFIPNSLITLLFSPALVAFGLWQLSSLKASEGKVPKVDRKLAVASLAVTVICLAMSLVGYVLMAVELYIWWIFQLTALQLYLAVRYFLKRYRKARVDRKVRAYRLKNQGIVSKDKGSVIEVTWLYDFIDMAVMPVALILSVTFCVYMAARVFDLTEICLQMLSYPFLNFEYLHLSINKLLVAAGLYFFFDYLSYLLRNLFRVYKLRKTMEQRKTELLHENDVNLTLANNMIAILVWGTYFLTALSLLEIPTKSLSVITAGLAAGIGFAMKDVLNNFFYGVQLMSGRLRVGDYIECDGVRGKVDSINYQMTQIVALDGSVMAFPNSSLINKNFKNLTKNHSYEFVAIPVGVAYGTDVDKARKVILEAIAHLGRTDKFGRSTIDQKYGVNVVLSDFGDNSVNLTVKQFVLVEERAVYIAKANEAIYKAFNANGIEIPFPQRDVYVKQIPGK